MAICVLEMSWRMFWDSFEVLVLMCVYRSLNFTFAKWLGGLLLARLAFGWCRLPYHAHFQELGSNTCTEIHYFQQENFHHFAEDK